jgi:hypothetical protein
VSGQLVLVQSLFAQLCAPLDHVGQHFRDCVSAAEDLRDLESLKTVLSTPQSTGSSGRMSENNNIGASQTTLYTDRNKVDSRNQNNGGMNINGMNSVKIPKVYRQYGGRLAWQTSPLRMEIKNLFFTYPSVGSINSNIEGVNRPILNNISFSIPPGGYSLGIVGPSGECLIVTDIHALLLVTIVYTIRFSSCFLFLSFFPSFFSSLFFSIHILMLNIFYISCLSYFFLSFSFSSPFSFFMQFYILLSLLSLTRFFHSPQGQGRAPF